ncbi:MAG: tyrosine-type recombinase/integrase [Bacillota bacterium]|nr:tyrosine-type recombinase/integrase [Bacillota bacterium]
MDYVELFIEYQKKNKKSINTIDSYKRDIIQFLNYIKKDIKSVDSRDVDLFIESLQNKTGRNGQPISIKSINRKLVSINRFIMFLNNEFDLKVSIKANLLKQHQQYFLDEMLSKNDFERIFRAADKYQDRRAKAIFYTLYYTGMRVSEMLQLETEDIFEDVVSIKGKGEKYRDIFLPDKLKPILQEYLQVRIDNGNKLFTGTRGPINRQTVDSIIKHYAGLARVKLSKAHAHNFRHLYCINLVDKGLSIDTIADLAGHSSINTTRIYTRKTKRQLLQLINEI